MSSFTEGVFCIWVFASSSSLHDSEKKLLVFFEQKTFVTTAFAITLFPRHT